MVLVLAAGAEPTVNHVVGVDGDSQGHIKVTLGGEREFVYDGGVENRNNHDKMVEMLKYRHGP